MMQIFLFFLETFLPSASAWACLGEGLKAGAMWGLLTGQVWVSSLVQTSPSVTVMARHLLILLSLSCLALSAEARDVECNRKKIQNYFNWIIFSTEIFFRLKLFITISTGAAWSPGPRPASRGPTAPPWTLSTRSCSKRKIQTGRKL